MRTLLLSVTLFAYAAAGAEQGKTALSAGEIIDKSIEATGGRTAMEKLTTTYAKGTMEFTAQHAHGDIELFAKAPDKQLIVMNLESVGQVKQGFDGHIAWAQDATGQVVEGSATPIEGLKGGGVLTASLNWRELYPKAELQGKETVGGKEAYVVLLTRADGKHITRYYDTQSFFLVRETSARVEVGGSVTVQAEFADYRDVNGVKAPFLIRQSLPNNELVLTISEMRNNVPIEDAKFAKPSN